MSSPSSPSGTSTGISNLGTRVSLTLARPWIYAYYYGLHAGMVGVIMVRG